MTEQTSKTPLSELLRRIPKDARLEWQTGEFSHAMAPVGLYCHEAAGWVQAGELIERCFANGIEVEISPPISDRHIAAVEAGTEMRDVSEGCPTPLWQSLVLVCQDALSKAVTKGNTND